MAAQLFLTGAIPNVTGTVGGTASKAVSGVRADADGINVVWAVYSVTTGQTFSVSDVINFCQVPEGATILDGYISGIIKSQTGSVVKLGLGAAGLPAVTGASTDGDLIAALTLSTTRVFSRFGGAATVAAVPYQTAAIAAATYPKSYPINLTLVSGTVTSSVSVCLYLVYTTAGQ